MISTAVPVVLCYYRSDADADSKLAAKQDIKMGRSVSVAGREREREGERGKVCYQTRIKTFRE